MDLRDLLDVGNSILDEVNEAVRKGDYSGLGPALRQMSEEMRSGSERLRMQQEAQRRQVQEEMRRREAQYKKGVYPGGNGAGAKGIMQPQAVAPAVPASTPFMQRQVSTLSGVGRIVIGTVMLVVSVLFFSLFLVLGLALSGGFMIGAGVFAALAAAMVWQIVKGTKRRGLVGLYHRFASLLGRCEYFKIEDLAAQTERTPDQIRADIKLMCKEGLLPQAKFDEQETTVMLTQQSYRQYLDAEKSRLEREAQERKKEEALGGLSGEAREILQDGENYLAMVRTANEKIPGDEMSDKLFALENIMNRIFAQVKKEPKSAQNLKRFMNYYLPTTQKLLDAYVDLDKHREDVANITNTKREIESAMDTINEAFENLLDSLFEEVAWDVSSDISAMRAMMAQDGLTADQMAQSAAGGMAAVQQEEK